jgi:hypothetical protein
LRWYVQNVAFPDSRQTGRLSYPYGLAAGTLAVHVLLQLIIYCGIAQHRYYKIILPIAGRPFDVFRKIIYKQRFKPFILRKHYIVDAKQEKTDT